MENTPEYFDISSDSEETIPEPQPEKIDRRRIKRAPWRTTVLEDGTIKYNDKPNDPHYHAKYYHAKRRVILCSPVNCEICGATVSKAHLTRHKQTTKKCIKLQNALNLNALE